MSTTWKLGGTPTMYSKPLASRPFAVIEDLTRVDVAAKVVPRVVAKRRGHPDPVVKAAH